MSEARPNAMTISVAELARRVRRSRESVVSMLAEWEQAGLVVERAEGWCLSQLGRRQLGGFGAIFDQLAEELEASTHAAAATPKAKRERPQPPEHLLRPRCSCGCGQPISMERYLGKHAFAEGHEPARKLSPREKLRREREADADAKPVTSTCSRCGATFGPGPVSVVREAFKRHACEVTA